MTRRCLPRSVPPSRRASALVLSVALVLAGLLPALEPPCTSSAELDELLTSLAGAETRVAVLAASLGDGRTVYEKDADAPYIPASVTKLLTAAAALSTLTPDHRFPIEARAAAEPTAGTLAGDLFLVGHGDPALTSDDLARLAREVHARGILRVRGDVVGDGSFFDRRDVSVRGAGTLAALAVGEGVPQVEVRAGKAVGKPAVVLPGPGAERFAIVNQTQTVGRRSRSTLRARLVGSQIVVSGKKPLRGGAVALPVAIDDPALHAATVFADALRKEGVRIDGRARTGAAPDSAGPIATAQGSGLREVLSRMLQSSDNTIAEQILLVLGAHCHGAPGTRAKGLDTVRQALTDLGLPAEEMTVADGSGLSKANRLTARFLVQLLRVAWTNEGMREVFLEGLPRAGATGTLRKRYRHADLTGKLLGKTGWLWGVGTLAGYYWTADGEPFAFAVLLNEPPGRGYRAVADTVDRIVLSLMQLPGSAVPPGSAATTTRPVKAAGR